MHAARAYTIAVGMVFVLLAGRLALRPWVGDTATYLPFFPAILIASWYGGFGPGSLATGLSSIAVMYFLSPGGFGVGGTGGAISLAFFIATGLSIAWLTEQLHAAAAASAARAERLNAIINTTVDGILVINEQGRIEAFNRGAERLFGYPESEVLGRNVSVLMPSPYHEEHDRYLERYLTTGDAKVIGKGREVSGRRRDGTIFPLHLSVGEMVVDGQRKFTGMLHDVSERARLKGELGTSEARWRAVIDAAVDGIIVIDAHGRIETFNPAAERLFGYQERDVIGRNVDMLMPSPYREEHDSYLSRYLATSRAKIIGVGREVTGLRKDRTTFPLHLSVGQILVEGERKFVGILHDLTERNALEARLREGAALARLGEMAAVIAHEIKNPLAGMRGAMQVFGKRLAEDPQATAVVKEIVNRIDSLDRMMKDLLLFARPPQPRRAPTDIAPLVSSTAGLIREDPSLNQITIDVEGAAPPVLADRDMLQVVFHNLLINSAHAMQGRGRIRVAVIAADSHCDIRFSDEGPGIPVDVRSKIFTPFFTTKSRGSGLGLPTVKRLVEAHQGEVSLHCPETGGTTVVVRLPLNNSDHL